MLCYGQLHEKQSHVHVGNNPVKLGSNGQYLLVLWRQESKSLCLINDITTDANDFNELVWLHQAEKLILFLIYC